MDLAPVDSVVKPVLHVVQARRGDLHVPPSE